MPKKLEIAKTAALEAGNIVLDHSSNIQIDYKETQNLVTQADLAAEKQILEILKNHYPDHAYLCEETAHDTDVLSDHLWIIDPLDGTNNFANGIPQFSISIAYAEQGEVLCGVVYDPNRRELFSAIKGKGARLNDRAISASKKTSLDQSIVSTGFYYDRGTIMEKTLNTVHALFKRNIRGLRRMGSAALDLVWVACSRYDAFFEYKLSPWDFAAGILIIKEAGGVCHNIDGAAMTLQSKGIICAAPQLIDQFLSVAKWNDG